MKLLIRAGLALALGFGALAAAPGVALAGPPCKDECEVHYPQPCAQPAPIPLTGGSQRRVADMRDPAVPDESACKDCDGVAEGGDGHDRGECVSNMYDFETQHFTCVTEVYAQQLGPTDRPPTYAWRVLSEDDSYWYRHDTRKGNECGRRPAPPL